jgi:dinuclear metal center YbgI/SA1388 family protein
MPRVGEIVAHLDHFAPPALAADWDNVGLLLGSQTAEVARVLTCLTLTPDVAAEAIAEAAQLVVTHHPILFRPVKRLTDDTSDGRLVIDLIKAGVAVYSPHTAFDSTRNGINDQIASKLGLVDVGPLRPHSVENEVKIVVFVPAADLGAVSDAMFAAGAGRIGQYRECGFRVAGTGTFFATENTNPAVGQKGSRQSVDEWRLEVVCPDGKVADVVSAMRAAHSYEEPAFDVYSLRSARRANGEGRTGRLAAPACLSDLANQVRRELKATVVQMVGDGERRVEHVAIVCGAGGDFLPDARAAKADVFVTGEARFHDCLAARAHGLSMILAGHFASERFAIEALSAQLSERFPGIEAWASRVESDPIRFVT